jgi:hypothetical protein
MSSEGMLAIISAGDRFIEIHNDINFALINIWTVWYD